MFEQSKLILILVKLILMFMIITIVQNLNSLDADLSRN